MGWDDWEWRSYFPPSAPKLPPPRHGIKVKKFGATWWGQRWLEALERFGAVYTARLNRGRSYARQGRVHDLEVEGGVITAQVTGTRAVPYRVTIRVAPLGGRVWDTAIRAMAARAIVAARLLAGEMPRDIDDAFHTARASLFPQRAGDLRTSCTCPDWANPCKHVAAVHYVLGEAFDRDPFLLFELRGRRKGQVLAALRRIRAAATPSGPAGRRPAARKALAAGMSRRGATTVSLGSVTPQRYESLREGTDDLRFHIATPAVEGAVLRQLGIPPSWTLRTSPMDLLYPAVAAAAALARELALGSPSPTQESGDDGGLRRRPEPTPGGGRSNRPGSKPHGTAP